MYVIDVIPLSRTAPGVLSYRSASDMPPGSIVDIVLRKTLTQGIVVSSLPVTHAKEMLKHARFLLSKSAPSASGMLPPSIMEAAAATATYHAASVGAVLAALFGEYIRAGVAIPVSDTVEGGGFVRIVSEKPIQGRSLEYEDQINECRARGGTALLVVPTLAECSFWKNQYASHKPLVLSGALTGSKRAAALHAAANHVGLIIATPSFSWAPITHLGCIIIDRVSAGTYTLPKRPYLNMVKALEELARARAIPLIYGDFPVPLEYRSDPSAPLLTLPERISVLDVRRDPDDQEKAGEPWLAVPKEVLATMREELADGGRVVVLTVRREYAPAVVCRDCGQAVVDERGVPLMFSTANGTRAFRSSDGKTVIEAIRVKCARCESWNLLPLGVGLERVVEELQKEFPQTVIVAAGSEALKSPQAARRTLSESLAPGTITVATEAFLPWMLGSVERLPLGVIASADSLLALPFWRARERFVRLAYLFRSLTSSLVLVTRHAEDTAVVAAMNPTDTGFFAEEVMLRTALRYPPFGTLVTLTLEGTSSSLAAPEADILSHLEAYAPSALPERAISATMVRKTIALTLPSASWPDLTLVSILQSLPPSVRVRIDPEALW